MTGFKKMTIAITLATTSIGAFATKPTNIKYIEDIVIQDDLIYSHYLVECSNGKTTDISAWNNRKKWCIGKGTQSVCYKRQIKVAKAVCK